MTTLNSFGKIQQCNKIRQSKWKASWISSTEKNKM